MGEVHGAGSDAAHIMMGRAKLGGSRLGARVHHSVDCFVSIAGWEVDVQVEEEYNRKKKLLLKTRTIVRSRPTHRE